MLRSVGRFFITGIYGSLEIFKILPEHGALLPDELECPDDDGRYDAWS